MLDPHKVKAWRTKRDMTQADVAAAVGKHLKKKKAFSVLMIVRYENPEEHADPTLSTIEGLAAAFGCRVPDLISEGDSEDREKAKPASDLEKNPEVLLRRRSRERDKAVAAGGRKLEALSKRFKALMEEVESVGSELREFERAYEAIGAEE